MTAVEYLENWLQENYIVIGVDFEQALIKAKELEKEQIIEAHGVKQKTKSNPGSIVTYGYNYTGEMYYNDKFLTPKNNNMENLAKISIVPMDYEERKERVIEAIITYLNYDSVSDERWHSPFSEERQVKVRKDAEKIAEIALDYYKLNL